MNPDKNLNKKSVESVSKILSQEVPIWRGMIIAIIFMAIGKRLNRHETLLETL
jgi:hypothetical protein